MTVYVDDLRMKARVGGLTARWSHLTATTDIELHEFAARLGLQPEWAQDMDSPIQGLHHYDVTDSKRAMAIRLGAVAETVWESAARLDTEFTGEPVQPLAERHEQGKLL